MRYLTVSETSSWLWCLVSCWWATKTAQMSHTGSTVIVWLFISLLHSRRLWMKAGWKLIACSTSIPFKASLMLKESGIKKSSGISSERRWKHSKIWGKKSHGKSMNWCVLWTWLLLIKKYPITKTRWSPITLRCSTLTQFRPAPQSKILWRS